MTKPTDAAMRAAKHIDEVSVHPNVRPGDLRLREKRARIIDEVTALPELLGVLREIIQDPDTLNDALFQRAADAVAKADEDL